MKTTTCILLMLAGFIFIMPAKSQNLKTAELIQGELYIPDSSVECLIIEGISSNKELKDIWSLTKDCKNLVRLEIKDCSLQNIRFDKSGLNNLKELKFEECPVLSIDKALFNPVLFENIHDLSFVNCERIKKPMILSDFKNLSALRICNTKIYAESTLPELFDSLAQLRQLVLKGISFSGIDTVVMKMIYLEELDLSDNGLDEIPDSISKMKSLRVLNLGGNQFDRREVLKLKGLPIDQLTIDVTNARDTVFINQILPDADILFNVVEKKIEKSENIKTELLYSYSFEDERYNSVKPPVRSLVKNGNIYRVKTESLMQIVSPAGSVVTIPANSIVDKKGNVVNGPVEIIFREFSDPLEIVFSGIPMTYDSAGTMSDFQTAGMFELKAMKDGEELKLAAGREIIVDLAAVRTDDGFSLYQYDDISGNWNFNQPSSGQSVNQGINIYSSAYTYYPSFFNIPVDTTSFSNRYLDTSYVGTFRYTFFNQDNIFRMPIFKMRRCRVSGMRKDIFFMLPYAIMNNGRPYSKFPELVPFNNLVWRYSGPLSKYDFIRKYLGGKKWVDLRLNFNEEFDEYTFELKSFKKYFTTLTATPYAMKELEAGDLNVFPTENKYEKYSSILKKKETRFNKRIMALYKTAENRLWKNTRMAMSKEEKKMSKDEWLAYARKALAYGDSIAWIQQRYSDVITRNFSVSGFGIWNCDRPVIYEDPVRIEASRFVNPDGEQISANCIYSIDNISKAVITNYVKQNLNASVKASREESGLLILSEVGKLYLLSKNQIKTIDSDSKTEIICEYIDTEVVSFEDVRKKLGF